MRTLLLITTLFLFASCHEDTNKFLQPTEDTYVREDMEENEYKDKSRKKLWLELLHGGPNSNWEQIEYENTIERNKYLSTLSNPNRDGEELLANGNILGKWIERGSSNQSGNVENVYYDTENDWAYIIGGGGPMFRGTLNGFQWELVNDDIKFDKGLMEMTTLQSGKKRLIASIGEIPHYSDDEGKTWKASTGFPQWQSGSNLQKGFSMKDRVYVIHRKSSSAKYILYYTKDGEKYTSTSLLSSVNHRDFAVCVNTKGDSIYTLEKITPTRSKLQVYDFNTEKLRLLNDSCMINLKDNFLTTLQVVNNGNDIEFMTYDEENRMLKSNDKGKNWTLLSKMLSNPWEVGFYVIPSKPSSVLYGEVNAYRSGSSGKVWNKINDWADYYANPKGKLHADIMCIKEFKDQAGKNVVLIGHHGGISKTYDYGATTENISLFGLHISQYYDARSYPQDVSWIFAGAQDQGMQRGNVTDELIGDFTQMISGDYGHIEFTGKDKEAMWIMYPDGALSFYEEPLSQKFPTAGYKMQNENTGAWMPPIIVDPHSDDNVVYLAGGSTGASGNYLIKVEFDGSDLKETQLPFNFGSSPVSAFAISPIDPKLWFAATANGRFFKSLDGGVTWKATQSNLSESQYLYGSCILPSALDVNVVYLSGSGYGPAPVYKSTNAGDSFIAMRTGMPSTVAFNIVSNEDETKFFAATEAGPYVFIVKDNKWYPLAGVNTPNQTYWSVEYVPEIQTARFATYGRGVWDFRESKLETGVSKDLAVDVKIGPNPTSNYLLIDTEMKLDNIVLYDSKGSKVNIEVSKNFKIDISDLKIGIYFVSLISDKKRLTKKIIKI